MAASSGTTPFSMLFLGFSMFIIAAAVMLVMLLFRLNIEKRAEEVGILRAVGFSAKKVRWLLLGEGAIVAAIASVAGLAVGVGYAWLMLAGLRTWWVSAVTTPFLRLYLAPASFAIGYLCGLLASLGAIAWGLRQMRHVALRRLLAGEATEETSLVRRRTWVSLTIAFVAALMAVGISIAGWSLSGEAQAGSFFGAGALTLTTALAFLWSRLRSAAMGGFVSSGPGVLLRLAMRNAARNPGRSTLTVGLVAAASFIILAVGAFHLQPPSTSSNQDTGTGGFALVAESDEPIFQDMNTEDGRYDLAFSKADDKTIADSHAKFYASRVHAGDDASCLNLYQTRQPRILGVPQSMIDRGGFEWAEVVDTSFENPWEHLDAPTIASAEVVPVVLDYATAVYSLHLTGKTGELFEIEDPRGWKLKFCVVGLLTNSIFQGSLLISETAFIEHFPDVSGFRFFLVDTSPDDASKVRSVLDRALGDYGFDAQLASDRLAGYLAVQN
ncbi:MAG TPA: FtsX-like permease family protein, partial [Pirellulales bacterium]|nr:FtsX-like permease family protein [Pirellulales bacterium]